MLVVTIVSRLKIYTDWQQAELPRHTMSDYNAACNDISLYAWENNVYGQYDLHHDLYDSVRTAYPNLRANHAVRCFARVSQSYKVLNKNERMAYAKYKNGAAERWVRELRRFKWRNGIELDVRLWGFLKDNRLSIATVGGRVKLDWFANQHNRSLLAGRTNSATLIYRRGKFFLHVACTIAESQAYEPVDFIGVDMGVANIAVTSDGDVWTNDPVEAQRVWYANRKALLQRVGTKSAKRRLKQLSGKERRFKRDVDHCLSKDIVANAERTGRGIAVEELTGIHERVRAIRKAQRPRHHAWSFYRLQTYIAYKARLVGVPVVSVDPAYTSQKCSACGCLDRRSRRSQSSFECIECGYAIHADLNAAINIRNRATQQAYGGFDPQAPSLLARGS